MKDSVKARDNDGGASAQWLEDEAGRAAAAYRTHWGSHEPAERATFWTNDRIEAALALSAQLFEAGIHVPDLAWKLADRAALAIVAEQPDRAAGILGVVHARLSAAALGASPQAATVLEHRAIAETNRGEHDLALFADLAALTIHEQRPETTAAERSLRNRLVAQLRHEVAVDWHNLASEALGGEPLGYVINRDARRGRKAADSLERAREFHERSLTAREDEFGPADDVVSRGRVDYAATLRDLGDLKGAERECLAALRALADPGGLASTRQAPALFGLGAIERARGKPTLALAYDAGALRLLEAASTPDWPRLAHAYAVVGQDHAERARRHTQYALGGKGRPPYAELATAFSTRAEQIKAALHAGDTPPAWTPPAQAEAPKPEAANAGLG